MNKQKPAVIFHCSVFRNANIISDVQIAHVAELVDAHGSGPCAARCGGSNPSVGTITAKNKAESLENIEFQGFFVVILTRVPFIGLNTDTSCCQRLISKTCQASHTNRKTCLPYLFLSAYPFWKIFFIMHPTFEMKPSQIRDPVIRIPTGDSMKK